ncbi:hypothetical protein [Bacillus cereus group sp. TH152-1LC]|uniref:hypothetical protein n=1 Tax=Bacillus cereus group sp. TH152-1LC TaxID=3018060 RepID=UPI0022E77507|nr:hypothetical protein [Bacillus cereus group sp. TH152-1LC]MDA1675341.1 hypothetical protein [Bacillus cereus group sp. TH152-1LC]
MEKMKVKLTKIKDEKWDVEVNGEVVGECNFSPLKGGCYEAKMNDGVKIMAFTQPSLKGMIEKWATK